MTTYVQKKERVFYAKEDVKPDRARNVGEMKRIGSCADRRAWATNDEERRQHMIEYKKNKPIMGTYVPVDVLIELVCATKNAEIESLVKKIEELEKLLEIYNQLDLTDEQRNRIDIMSQKIHASADTLESSFEDSESTAYGICVETCKGKPQVTQTEACTDETCTQTALSPADVGAINIDFNIEGSADLQIDVDPVCDPKCDGADGPQSVSDLKKLLAQKDQELLQLQEQYMKLQCKISSCNATMDLEKKLTHSQLALASAQQEKAQLAKAITSSKTPELLQLEDEIAGLRANPNLTPEQETEIIKKELDVLKRYCDQLSNIQEENDQLKLENDYLKAQFGDCGDIQVLKQKSAMLDTVTAERDSLQVELKRLAGGMEILRRRSDAADQLENEKMELQKQLNDTTRARRQSDYDLELVRSENEDHQKSLEKMRCERDGLKEKVVEIEAAYNDLQRQTLRLQCAHQEAEQNCARLEDELNRLRCKAKEADVYRLERDRLQIRVEELSALEVEVLTLVEQVKNLSIERDVLKRQGCELHNIIADQEHEIKALLLHVDRLSQCVEKQQDKIRTALDELHGELERKNFLLASSQEQLQSESQQRSCLAQVENDLRKTIVELKNELNEKEVQIKCLQNSQKAVKCTADGNDLIALENENRTLRQRIEQLECVCSHKHVDEILETSKQAVEVVIEEIKNNRGQTPKVDHSDYMLEENKQLRKHSKDIQNMATERIDQLSNDLKEAQKLNEYLRAENEKLKLTKGIETDFKIDNSQLEDTMPSSESDKTIMEELKNCRKANAKLEMKLKSIQQKTEAIHKPTTSCTCDIIKQELERCSAMNAEIQSTISNLNRTPSAIEKSKSTQDLRHKLELCQNANEQLQATIKNLKNKAEVYIYCDEMAITIEEQLEVEISVRKQLQNENDELKAELQEKDELIKKLDKNADKSLKTLYDAAHKFSPEEPLTSGEQETQDLLRSLQEENQKLKTIMKAKDAFISKIQADVEESITLSSESGPSDIQRPDECPASINYILAEKSRLEKQVAQLQKKVEKLQFNLKEKSTNIPQRYSDECPNCPKHLAKIAELQNKLNNLQKSTKPVSDNEMKILQENNNQLETELKMMSNTLLDSPQTKKANKNVCSLSVCAAKTEIQRLKDQSNANFRTTECTCTLLKTENIKLKNELKQIKEERNALQQELDCLQKAVTKYTPPPTYNAESLAVCAAKRLSSGTNDQLLIENKRLQMQMYELKIELHAFSCLLRSMSPIGSEHEQNQLRCINVELAFQVEQLKKEVCKLTRLKMGVQNDQRDADPEQKQLCSRVRLLQEEIERLRECQIGDSTDVECLKKIIIQQEYDVDKLRSENCHLKRALQDCEETICLPVDEKIQKTIDSLKREIVELKCENECLRTCLTSTSPTDEMAAISKLGSHTSNKELRKEIDELRNQLDCANKCAASDNTKKELEYFRSRHQELKDTIQELESKLTSACEEMCKSKQIQKCSKSLIDDLRKKVTELECQNSMLKNEIQNTIDMMNKRLADATKALEDRIRLLEDEKSRMKQELQELLERLEQSVNACAAQESELEAEIQRLKNRIAELETKNATLESQLTDCREQQDYANNRIKELEDKLNQLEADKAHLEARLVKMAEEQDELTRRLEDKIREANEREIAFESEVLKLKARIKALEDENMNLEKQLAEARNALLKLEEEIREKLLNLEKQLEALELANKKLQEANDKLLGENADFMAKINALELECSELENNKGDFSAITAEMKEQYNALQKQHEICLEEKEKLLKEVEKLRKEKDDMKKEITDLLSKLQICDVNLADSNDKENLEALVKKMEIQLKDCDIKCKDTRQLDLELQRLLEENARLKALCEEEKRALQAQFEKSLALLKEQYDRDLQFVRGRHSEGIIRLQDMHEDTVSDTVKEYEREIERLQRQVADLIKQKQLDDEIIKRQQEEFEKYRIQMENELDRCRTELKEVTLALQQKLLLCEEENARLKTELEISRKCCEENEKLKKKLEEERNKLKASLTDVSKTSMKEVIKMRSSLDSLLQKNEAEISKLKSYIKNLESVNKNLEAELAKARKDLENQKLQLQSEINKLKTELENAMKCCAELESIKAKLELANDKSKQLQDEIDKLKAQLAFLTDEIINEKKRSDAELDKMKAELNMAKKCCDELEAIKKNLANDNRDLESEIDLERKKCLSDLEDLKKSQLLANKKYEDTIAELRKELAQYKKCCEELEKCKRDLENNLRLLKGAGDAEVLHQQELINLKAQLENQKNQYELEIARLRRELDDKARLEEELASLKRELMAKQKCCDDLELLKIELEVANAKLHKAYENDASKCEEELERIKAELNKIRKQYDNELAKLKKELENCKNLISELQLQKDELEKQNSSLKAKLAREISDKSNEVSKLKSEFEKTKRDLEEEIARLKRELAIKQKCCDDLELVQKQLEAKTKEMNALLAAGSKDSEDELAKLRKELENMRKKYEDELNKLKAELDSERKKAEEAAAKLRKELEDQKRRADNLESMVKNLEKSLADTKAASDESLDNCLEELARIKKDLERNKKRYEEEIERLKAELLAKNKCCEDLENVKNELDKANKALIAAKGEMSSQAAEEIDSLKKDLENLKNRYEEKLDSLKLEMAAERKQYEAEIARLKEELEKCKKTCVDLEEILLASQKENARLEMEINKLKQDLQNEKDYRQRDVDELNVQLNIARQCCKDLEEVRRELETEMKRHEKDLEKLRKDFENQLKRTADDLAECRTKLRDLENRYEDDISKLKKELSEKAKCCEELELLKTRLLDDEDSMRRNFENELKNMQAELDIGRKCCEDLEEVRKQLVKAKKDCEDELAKQAQRLKELENENESLAYKLNILQNDNNKLKKDLENEKMSINGLQDCKDELTEQKKRCEVEIAKLKDEIEKLKKCCQDLEKLKADLNSKLDEINKSKLETKKLKDEIDRLKEEIKIGKKCCEDLEKAKKSLKDALNAAEEAKKNRRDSSTQEGRKSMDATTQDGTERRDSSTQDQDTKVCPCGAIAQERGIRVRQRLPNEISIPTKTKTKAKSDVSKLEKLSKATALIVEVKQGTEFHPRQYALTKKSIVITNVEPSSTNVNKQMISVEEERPVNLTRSIESILSKALKLGLENLPYDELKDLHLKTRDAVSVFDPQVRHEIPLITESEITLTKLPLQRRISQLEEELTRKQTFACEKMCELENTICMERQQMAEMKNVIVIERKKNYDNTSKLGWENDSLKQQASFHEHRLQQLLVQVEQEKARSTSLKADLLKAKTVEAELLKILEDSRVKGQCAFSERYPKRLEEGSCARAKMKLGQTSMEPDTSGRTIKEEKGRRSTLKDVERRRSSTKSDSLEGRGDEKNYHPGSKKTAKKTKHSSSYKRK